MEKYYIKNGDRVFATGVFLIRDDKQPSGWSVDGFEDDTYFDGANIQDIGSGDNKPYIGGEEE